jgi:uncharacterized membrane protein
MQSTPISTIVLGPTVATANACSSDVGRHAAETRGHIKGFFILLGSLIGMFFALLVGGVIALAGLAGGILGMMMVGVFLVSVMIFFWELVLRADDLYVDAPSRNKADAHSRDRKADIASNRITDYDWIGEQAHRDERYYGQANYVEASHDTTPLQTVSGRRLSRPRSTPAI